MSVTRMRWDKFVRTVRSKMMTVAAKLMRSQPARRYTRYTRLLAANPRSRPVPNPMPARMALQHALALLETPDDPAALAAARQAAWRAFGLIPYPWQAPGCESTRQGWRTHTCLDQGCTRCAAYEAGEPMPEDDR
jgi:hypothetical protein